MNLNYNVDFKEFHFFFNSINMLSWEIFGQCPGWEISILRKRGPNGFPGVSDGKEREDPSQQPGQKVSSLEEQKESQRTCSYEVQPE